MVFTSSYAYLKVMTKYMSRRQKRRASNKTKQAFNYPQRRGASTCYPLYHSVKTRTLATPKLQPVRQPPQTEQNTTTTTTTTTITTTTTTTVTAAAATATTTRSTSVDPSWLSFSSQPCHPSLPASSLWGPRCPPPADRQMCQPVLRRSFCHALVPTKPSR